VSAFFLNIYQILKFEFGETKHFLNTLKWRRYGAIYRPVFWGLTAGLPFNFLLPRDPSYGFERTAQLSTGRFAAKQEEGEESPPERRRHWATPTPTPTPTPTTTVARRRKMSRRRKRRRWGGERERGGRSGGHLLAPQGRL
jgi:hypothetical protein